MSVQRFQPHAVFNGRLIQTGMLRVSPLGDGFMFGHGLFETLRVVQGRPVFLDEHFTRLERSATVLRLAMVSSCEQLRARCREVIMANALEAGSLKVVLFQDEEGSGEIILARDNVYPAENYERGFRLKTEQAGQRGLLAAHKTLNYFGNISAKGRAVAAGFDEPLFADAAGVLLEGATTNLFVVTKGAVRTPPGDGRILPGVMRGQVLRLLKQEDVAETAIDATALAQADEVFVTNALLGVMPVAQVDDQRYDVSCNPVTRRLMAAVAVGLSSIR